MSVPVGGRLSFDGILAVAVVGARAAGLDVRTMQVRMFQQVGEKLGASLAIDGADGEVLSRRSERAQSVEESDAVAVGARQESPPRLGVSSKADEGGDQWAGRQEQWAVPAVKRAVQAQVEKLLSLLCVSPPPPPPSPAEVEEGRCYLLFSEANGGCFMLQWSETAVEGALACFLPCESVAQHKYTRHGGISELCRNVGGPNVKKFFGGWLSFIKMAHSHSGKLTFLQNLPKLPGERLIGALPLC